MPPRVEIAIPYLEGLFPPGVTVGASPVNSTGEPGERRPRTIEQTIAARRAEFETGRAVARELIRSMGRSDGSIGIGPRRAPIWPEGVVGSISHSCGVCVVAVACAESYVALGVDLEADEFIEPALWPAILGPAELAGVDTGDVERGGRFARLVFSAKESVFKAQFPVTGADLEFGQVSIRWGRNARGFVAEFSDVPDHVRRLSTRLRGSSRVADGWIVTAAWIEASRHRDRGTEGRA